MRLASCSLVLVTAAACHSGGTAAPGNRSGGAEPPADLLSRHAGAMRPVLVEDGKPYLWLHMIQPYGDTPDEAPPAPACAEENTDCWKTMPAPADKAAALGPLPATVTVLTAKGTCVAKVEPVVIVNTSGCEPSMTYAAPLTGCDDAIAPVAFTAADVANDLRWLPAPPVKMAALPADAAALTDLVQRRYVAGWLAAGNLAGTRRDGRTGVVSVDAGAEALTTVVAGALVGDSADECELNAADEQVLGLRRGDDFTELALTEGPEVDGYVARVTEWDGAIAWRDRVVGVISGRPRQVMVHAVGPGTPSTPLFTETIWWDNEECTQGTWSGVEYPCGP
ncbi:MAG: hypothetical protein IPL61_30470 [Myxococcales bacterium]|nr:hypothetical protein [Myxococcales bacterium]